MEPQSGIKTWQWVVTVIVIIVLIIIGIMVFGNKSTSTITEETATPAEETTSSTEINRIVVSDQFPGNVVNISSVLLANGGWVEIHADKNGQPGDYIGSAYFTKGINTGKITLTKSTVEGGIYYAMLHSDDGDKKFDTTKDLPIKDSKGNIIMKLFRVSATVDAGIKG
ncbi:MAG: hypothetical protein AAB470_00455 [Patescibacteria group bacterium]